MEHELTIIERALIFATNAHAGTLRKDGHTPYILHCCETASIVAELTSDQETIAAALLHDTLEDTDTTESALAEEFGPVVTEIVKALSENKRPNQPPEQTWLIRKEETISVIEHASDSAVLMLSLADKLSNLRGIYKDYLQDGDDIWERFHQKSKHKQAWYYYRLEDALSGLSDSLAWKEFHRLRIEIFEHR